LQQDQAIFLQIIVVASRILAAQTVPPIGKFYIVGMGTAPDLITVRAQKVIARLLYKR